MLTRRAWFGTLIAAREPCYCICGFDGSVLRAPLACAAQPPGSTLKPLLAGLMGSGWQFRCSRRLRVQGHMLDCAHTPILGPLDLETALAASCNSWFAQAARRLEAGSVQRTIQSFGGRATAARTMDELLLVVLGVEKVWFTPGALAGAYARVRREAGQAVLRGLRAALTEGTAARAVGLFEAGKTGTVRGGGWFAGWTDRAVMAVYVEGGTGGGVAAPAAREIMARWLSGYSA